MKSNRVFQNLLCLAFSIMLLASCGSNSSSNQIDPNSNYKLAIVDSVQIDALSKFMTIADVHQKTGEILAVQSSPPKLWILSPQGEVKSVWEKQGDSPEGIGSLLLSAEFFGDDIAMMGVMRLKIFNRDFEVLKSLKPHYTQKGMIYTGFNHLFEYIGNGERGLISFFGGPQTEASRVSEAYYEEFNIVDKVNLSKIDEVSIQPEDSVFKPLGSPTSNSRFKNGKAYLYMKPVFDVKENNLIYTIANDTVLYQLDLNSEIITDQYKIPFDEFLLNDGLTMGSEAYNEQNKPQDREGQIERVFSVADKEVVIYRSGMSLEDYQSINRDEQFLKNFLSKNPVKYLIVKDGQRLNNTIEPPMGIITFDLADDFGYIWAHQNISQLEEEPEKLTFYKLKIVADEE